MAVAAETRRPGLQELGWEWTRAKVTAKDEEPERVEKVARIRLVVEPLRAGMALFFAEELGMTLVPKGGSQWLPKGEHVEGLTPGTNEKRYWAGAVAITTGPIPPCGW
jgi:DDE superfamily endonuclease